MSPDDVPLHDKPARTAAGFVRVRGARDHNLKNVDVDIPRDCLVVFTGISGSGKSSLAFGTLYAEAQRRYFESVAPYARRLIEQVGVPDVDSIEGLPPAVALQQQRGTSSTRSSVGSVTTLSDLLRMLYSRAGNYPARQPMLYAEDFSANTPQGACPTCHGAGRIYEVTEKAMVPDDSLSIRNRAIAAWPPAWQGQNLRDILVTMGYDVDRPWRELPRKDRDWILFTDEQPTVPVYPGLTPAETRQALRRKREPDYQGTFMGARKYVLHTFSTTQSELMKKRASRFMTGSICPECHGKRLKHASLMVTFAGYDIGEISQMPLSELANVLGRVVEGNFGPVPNEHTLGQAAVRKATERRIAAGGAAHAGSPDVRRTPNLSEEKRIAAQRMSQNMLERITTLRELGLGYLSLDRITPTLSPGELQRLRLATQIRSSLFGVVYVLDEPSAGLHPADTEALLGALNQLQRSGNSLFVVEHDLEVMRHADWIVDVGPDAGAHGGQVLYSGPLDGLRKVSHSHTARHLFSKSVPHNQAPRAARGWLKLRGITRNNLHGVDVDFPLSVFTTITGVSGSGKSTLVSQAMVELLSASLGQAVQSPSEEAEDMELSALMPTAGHILSGAEYIKRLVTIDQKPIGRTPRSNLATYTGLFDHVRRLFAATRDAKLHRYDAGRFSFNVAKGRCGTCEGQGSVSVELLFMPSVYAPCPTCHGARYNEQTLKICYRDRNIAEVLAMSVEGAYEFFNDEPGVQRPLRLLREIGLGYLGLGQPATELSGGEAQRIKLATELQRLQHGDTLYVIDEPTIGLHPADVDKLMLQLEALVDAGNSVIVAEHEMRVAAASDWVIEMGPGAGDQGGRIVASGTPHELLSAKHSRTAPYLAKYMK
jgi:excinuclease ABC subunit A